MAFFALDYLKNGKVDFLDRLTDYDKKHLIDSIRESKNRVNIINGFINILKDDMPYFCYDIIYDIPEFSDIALEIVRIDVINYNKLDSILSNTYYGDRLLDQYLDYFINKDDEYIRVISKYALNNNKVLLINKLSRNSNLHVRYIFMEYLINNNISMLDSIYDDISKYTTSITYEENEQLTLFPKLINVKDISNLAYLLLKNNRLKDYYNIKEFILREYKANYLASLLLGNDQEKEFIKDSDRLFDSSIDSRLSIYLDNRYSKYIKKELLDKLNRIVNCFHKDKYDYDLLMTYMMGLGKQLEEYVDKYLEYSRRKDYEYVGGGTTCSCYRIGDYAFKLVKTKWSYEDIICPDLYLIVKNLEENYLRDGRGIVKAGLEVQKYLSRRADNLDIRYFHLFDQELNRLGYKRTDTLTKGSRGENTMLLDSYKDADCDNPERLPEWFKEYPLVLIDRDRIYRKDNKCIKQLRSGGY